jgi:phosphatidylglycerophosphate synthase
MSELRSRESVFRPGVVKEVDGVFAELVAGPIAAPIVRLLLDTPVTPNQVTMASFALRVAAAYLLASGTWGWNIVAATVLLAGFVLDMVDGQLARARGTGTKLGAFLDKFTDRVSEAAIYAGAAAGFDGARDPGDPSVWPLAFAALAAVFLRSLADEMVVTQFELDRASAHAVAPDGALTRGLRAAGIDDELRRVPWVGLAKRLLWFSEGERLALLSIAALVLRIDLYFWLILIVAAPSWLARLVQKVWRLR